MRKYEAVMIVVPDLGEEGLQQVAQKFTSLVESSGGSVDVLRSLGRRTLAYRIGAYEEGVYVLTQFSCEPSFVEVLRRELRLWEQVIRCLIVRLEEGIPLEQGLPEEEREEEAAEEEREEEAAVPEVALASTEGSEEGAGDASLAEEVATNLEPQPLSSVQEGDSADVDVETGNSEPETEEGGEEGAE